MAWTNPIHNRTYDDVVKVKRLKKKIDDLGFDNVSNDEKAEYLSEMIGAFSFVSANRIENNTEYVYNIALGLGYLSADMTFKEWSNSTDMYQADFERIKSNISLIADAIDLDVILPQTMTLHYEKINQIEKALFDIHNRLNHLFDDYRYSNTVYAGDLL